MKMYHHKKLPFGTIHALHNWRVLDIEDLFTLSVDESDEGKCALIEEPRDLVVLLQYPDQWYSLITGDLIEAPLEESTDS